MGTSSVVATVQKLRMVTGIYIVLHKAGITVRWNKSSNAAIQVPGIKTV
jgi:hypothetical protein